MKPQPTPPSPAALPRRLLWRRGGDALRVLVVGLSLLAGDRRLAAQSPAGRALFQPPSALPQQVTPVTGGAAVGAPRPQSVAAPGELSAYPCAVMDQPLPASGAPAAPGFMRSLGRYGPPTGAAPSIHSVRAAPWDWNPDFPAPPPAPPCEPRDAAGDVVPFAPVDFSPDPAFDCYLWDGCSELGVYGDKHLNAVQRPWVECFTPLYGPGPWPPSYTFLGPTNLVRPKLYVYGDFRTATAINNNVANSQGVWANRLNLDIDFSITATERFHMFWGPLDQGQQFTGLVVDDGDMEVNEFLDGFDQNTDAMFFEGDLGYILGGLWGVDAPFDLPVAAGLIPLVLQNGIWLEDAFVGAAATIPARSSPWRDWSNFDTTFFVGFDELTTPALAGSDNATFVGATTFIERRGGYIELGWAYVDDPTNSGLSYHNLGLSYTRRYLNLVSNSARAIINAGQDGPENDRTADGCLLLLENSLLTPLPYNVVPYMNFFAGFDRPRPLGRLQGPLKNTGINFESDLLTGYPILDDSGNNTYGGAFGVDLLGRQFNRQLIVETAVLQAFDDPASRVAPGDQYALGLRYQRRLNNSLILRADAMHGWLENSNDIDGARVELRHKF